MKHSEWIAPTTEEVHELEVNQIEEAAGGNNKNNIPINGGMWLVLLIVIIFGLWRQSRISLRSTSAYSLAITSTDKNTNTKNETLK